MRPFRTCCMIMMILFACAPADAGCGLFSGMRARRAARQQAACGVASYQSYGYATPAPAAQQCAPCGQAAPMILQSAPGTSYYPPRTIYSVPMQAQMDCSNGTCTLRR